MSVRQKSCISLSFCTFLDSSLDVLYPGLTLGSFMRNRAKDQLLKGHFNTLGNSYYWTIESFRKRAGLGLSRTFYFIFKSSFSLFCTHTSPAGNGATLGQHSVWRRSRCGRAWGERVILTEHWETTAPHGQGQEQRQDCSPQSQELGTPDWTHILPSSQN
jgi:hypothetical protein